MNLLEINKVILGNPIVELPEQVELLDFSSEIKEIIPLCTGMYNKSHLSMTRSFSEFYKMNPLMDCFISDYYKGKDVRLFKKELFYSMIAELYVPGIPSELLAMFVLAQRSCDTPNKAVLKLDRSKLKKYFENPFSSNPLIYKELLDLLFGFEVQLVTENIPVVTNDGIVEAYLSDIDEVVISPEMLRNKIPDVRDYKKLKYNTDKGVVIGEEEIPIRTFIHKFGIVTDDLDLRTIQYASTQENI